MISVLCTTQCVENKYYSYSMFIKCFFPSFKKEKVVIESVIQFRVTDLNLG